MTVNKPIQPIIFFDGECGLCNGFVDFVLRKDKKKIYQFSTLQGETAQTLGLTSLELKTVVLKRPEGTYVKSSAALRIISSLGGFWSFFRIFLLVPAFIRDFVYDLIATYRYRLFGKVACRIPSAEERLRFVP